MATPPSPPTTFEFKGQISAVEGPDSRGNFVIKVDGRTTVYLNGANQEVYGQFRIGAPRDVLGALAFGDRFKLLLEKQP